MTHSDDKAPPVPTGTLLAGKYRVERVLGQGGMGIVLAATNEALQRRVAVKLLRGAAVDAKALGRFEREARAAARLRSEHVARVLDVGNLEDGRPYMVMEYLEGCDLGHVIDEGPVLSVGELVDYVLQACEAIAEAHSAGIIHRDLKPRNLFLSTSVDGRPLIKVLDFGISKIEDGADDFGLTRTTEIIGSPSYMSPEQLRASKDVDLRTDIWALGVILYELITKRVPFYATTLTELVAIVLMDPTPDVRTERPDVPEGLVLAIHRCLAKRREDRFSSIAELAQAIAPFGSGAMAGMAERITRVGQGSGRSLPPSDTGSGPQPALPTASPAEAGVTRTVSVAAPGVREAAPVDAAESPRLGITPGPNLAGGAPLPISGEAPTTRLAGTTVAWGETHGGVPSPPRRSRRTLVRSAIALFVVANVAAAFYVSRQGSSARSGGTTLSAESVVLPAAQPGALTLPIPVVDAAPPVAVDASGPPTSAPASERSPAPRPTWQAKVAPKATAEHTAPPPVRASSQDDLSGIGRR